MTVAVLMLLCHHHQVIQGEGRSLINPEEADADVVAGC